MWRGGATYLDVEVTVESFDQDDEAAGHVVRDGRRFDWHACVLRPRPNQEALRHATENKNKLFNQGDPITAQVCSSPGRCH